MEVKQRPHRDTREYLVAADAIKNARLDMFVGAATAALADKLALPTLGTSPLLAGEAKAVQRGKKIAVPPET